MKNFLAALGLSLLVIPSCVDAAALAQRGDTDIFFTQSEITDNRRQYFEFQRIVNYKDKDVNLLHLRIKGENFASAKLVHEASGTIIPLEQVEINHDFVLPADRIDKWYKYDNIAWQKIAQYIADQGARGSHPAGQPFSGRRAHHGSQGDAGSGRKAQPNIKVLSRCISPVGM